MLTARSGCVIVSGANRFPSNVNEMCFILYYKFYAFYTLHVYVHAFKIPVKIVHLIRIRSKNSVHLTNIDEALSKQCSGLCELINLILFIQISHCQLLFTLFTECIV